MFDLIRCLFKMNIKKWMEYRADFIIGIVSIFLTNLISITFFWVLFQHITLINGWTFDEIMFILGLYYTSFGIWHLFLQGPTPHRIERYIINGELDGFLVRPVNTLKLLIMSKIDDDGIGDLVAGLIIFFYASNSLSIVWSLSNIALLMLTVFGSVLIIFSISLILTAAGFWVIRSSTLTDLLYPFMRFIEFPLEMYNPFVTFILTFVIPLGFVNYYPAQAFLGKGVTYLSYLTPVVGIVFFIIAYSAWKHGLNNYSSTGN
jgi:ABC-2 type transport system permease protein